MNSRDMKTISSLKELPGEMLRGGLKVRVRATGNSMHPRIRSGSLVQIDPLGNRHLQRGMVVCLRLNKEYVLHRIVAIRADQHIVTRADFYAQADSPVPLEDVLGIAVFNWKGANVHGKGKRIRRYHPLWISLCRPFFRLTFRLIRKNLNGIS